MEFRKLEGKLYQHTFPLDSQENRILSAFRNRPDRTIFTFPSIRMSASGKVYEKSMRSNVMHLHRNRMLFVAPVGIVLSHLLDVDFITGGEKDFLKELNFRNPLTTIVISPVAHLHMNKMGDNLIFRTWDNYFNVFTEVYQKNKSKWIQ